MTEVIEPAVYNPATGATVTPTYQYTYDSYGDLTSSTDALGHLTQYGYNQFGNMVSETLPMGGQSATSNYNSLDQLTSQTDFDGNTTDYTYYGTGSSSGAPGDLETKTVYAAGSQTAYETVTYAYNVNYNAQGDYDDTVTDSLSGTTTTSEYDVNGDLIQISSPQGTINYTYDLATGNGTGISTSNSNIQYSYDQAGDLKTVTVTKLDGQALATPLVTSYSYDLDGNLVTTQNANGTTETRAYNNINELTSIVDTGPSGTIASFAYTYDPDGNVSTETDLNGTTYTYVYDSLNRLTQETISGIGTQTWTYDLVGNRVGSTNTAAPANQQSLTYTYNANGELTSLAGSNNYGQTYTYDADGNTLTVTGTGGASSATYSWDPRGRMTSASTGGVTTSFTYNGSGDRTSETVGSSTTTFLNNPNQAYDEVLEQYAQGGVLAATYIQGLDLLFEDRSGARSFYVTDNIGSTRALTNSAGAVTDTYTYDAFGNLIGGVQVTGNPFLFAGQWFDSSIGQYYDRARFYNQSVGRFDSMDSDPGNPGNPISENLFAYASDDPALFTDPTGHESLIDVLSTINFGDQVDAMDAGAAQQALQVVRSFQQVFQFVQNVVAKGKRAYDLINQVLGFINGGIPNLADAFGEELLTWVAGIAAKNVHFTSPMLPVPVPQFVVNYLKTSFKEFWGLPVTQQLLGEVFGAMVSSVLGFQTTDISIGYRGLDAVLKNTAGNFYAVLEAKGGPSSRLDPTVNHGRQMSEEWIKWRIGTAVKNTNSPGDKTGLSTAKNVLAVVMKTVLTGNGPPTVYIQAQTYPGVGPWDTKFTTTT